MVLPALASDAGGSIRMPASNCGLVGIKPGPGVVPFPPTAVSTWSRISEYGRLATTVADLGLALDVLAGGDVHRAVAPPARPLRVGVSAEPGALGVKVYPEMRAALDATAEGRPRRRLYELTGAGERALAAWQARHGQASTRPRLEPT